MRKRHIREHVLQMIWAKQYIRKDALETLDGLPIKVFSPGSVSLQPGPDIRGAIMQIGDVLFSGDIEIHRSAHEWFTHGHHTDPAYNSVILHVLLYVPPVPSPTPTAGGRNIPQASLEHILPERLQDLTIDASMDAYEIRSGRLHCSGLNHGVSPETIARLLKRQAMERREIKIRRFSERLHELTNRTALSDSGAWPRGPDSASPYPTERAVWEQLLYEGLMEGLGYTRNRRPFMQLSRVASLAWIRECTKDRTECEAMLFAVSGLLEGERNFELDAEAAAYIHILSDAWRRIRTAYHGEFLARHDWKQGGRPGNSPYIRVVAGGVLAWYILHEDLLPRMLDVLRNDRAPRRSLHRLLTITADDFWERRISFSRVTTSLVHPLGSSRRDDLIINIVVPLFLVYARVFRDARIREATLDMMSTYPALQPNNITRRIGVHLVRDRMSFNTASIHQGAIQLYHFYCKEGRCVECDVGQNIWADEPTGVVFH